jgi:hypothetical protein
MTRETTTTTTPPQEMLPTATITMPVGPSHATVLSNITNDDSLSSTNTNNSSFLEQTLKHLTSGYAGEFVTSMLQYAIKNERNTYNLFKRYKDGKTLRESLAQQQNKRFMAGSLFKANRVVIDDELLEYMEEKELEAVRKQHVSISKHRNEYLTNKYQAELVFASKKKPEVMFIAELKAVAKWKKRKGDNAIPYVETIQRPDLTLACAVP